VFHQKVLNAYLSITSPNVNQFLGVTR